MQKNVLVFIFCVLLNEVAPKVSNNKDYLTNKKAALVKQLGPHTPWRDISTYNKETKNSQNKTKTLVNLLKVVSAKEIDVLDNSYVGNITIGNATIETEDAGKTKDCSIENTKNLKQTTDEAIGEDNKNDNTVPKVPKPINNKANATVSKVKKKYLANETIGGRLAMMKLNATTEKPKTMELNAPTMIPIFRPTMQTNSRNAFQPFPSELIRHDVDDHRQMKSQHPDANMNSLSQPHEKDFQIIIKPNLPVNTGLEMKTILAINTVNEIEKARNHAVRNTDSKTIPDYNDSPYNKFPNNEIYEQKPLTGKGINLKQNPNNQINFQIEKNGFIPVHFNSVQNGMYSTEALPASNGLNQIHGMFPIDIAASGQNVDSQSVVSQNIVNQNQNGKILSHANGPEPYSNYADSVNIHNNNYINSQQATINPVQNTVDLGNYNDDQNIRLNRDNSAIILNAIGDNHQELDPSNLIQNGVSGDITSNNLSTNNPIQNGFFWVDPSQNGFISNNGNQNEFDQIRIVSTNANLGELLNTDPILNASPIGLHIDETLNQVKANDNGFIDTSIPDQNNFSSPYTDQNIPMTNVLKNNGIPSTNNMNFDQNGIVVSNDNVYQNVLIPNEPTNQYEISNNVHLNSNGLKPNSNNFGEVFNVQNIDNVNSHPPIHNPTEYDLILQELLRSYAIPNGQVTNGLPVNAFLNNNPSKQNEFLLNALNPNFHPGNNVQNVMTNLEAYIQRVHAKPNPKTQGTGFTLPCLKASDILEDLYRPTQIAEPNIIPITETTGVKLQCDKDIEKDGDDESVAIVFKPKNISLLKFYGDLLKKITLTVLVPYHISKLTKDLSNINS